MKCFFPAKPLIRPLTGKLYALGQDYYFLVDIHAFKCLFHITAGFQTDGASIPRWFWFLFGCPYDPQFVAAAICHDALYGGELLPRWFCDWTFYKLLRDLGVPWWKSSLMFVGVRLGGWIVWIFEHDRQSVAAARSHILTRFDRYAPPRFPAREVPRPESQNQTKGTST